MALAMECPMCGTGCWDYYCQECNEYFLEFDHDFCPDCGAGGDLECLCE